MEINQGWPTLDDGTKQWLTSHNGERVPAAIFARIVQVAGVGLTGGWWVGEQRPGLLLSDEAVDWSEFRSERRDATPTTARGLTSLERALEAGASFALDQNMHKVAHFGTFAMIAGLVDSGDDLGGWRVGNRVESRSMMSWTARSSSTPSPVMWS